MFLGLGLSSAKALAAAAPAPSMALEEITVCRNSLSRVSLSRRYLFVVSRDDFFMEHTISQVSET